MSKASKYNPLIHHRRSIRLKGYDYSQAGAYFITICCHENKCRFGNIVRAPLAGAPNENSGAPNENSKAPNENSDAISNADAMMNADAILNSDAMMNSDAI